MAVAAVHGNEQKLKHLVLTTISRSVSKRHLDKRKKTRRTLKLYMKYYEACMGEKEILPLSRCQSD